MMCHMTSDHAHLQVGPADQAGEVVERVSDRCELIISSALGSEL